MSMRFSLSNRLTWHLCTPQRQVVDVMPSDVTSLEAERKFLRDHILPLGKPDPSVTA